jgi:hypothetical protein
MPAEPAALSSVSSRMPHRGAGPPMSCASWRSPGTPVKVKTTTSRTIACTKCMAEPPDITTTRLGNDCWRKVRGSSAGSVSSRLFIPMMRT